MTPTNYRSTAVRIELLRGQPWGCRYAQQPRTGSCMPEYVSTQTSLREPLSAKNRDGHRHRPCLCRPPALVLARLFCPNGAQKSALCLLLSHTTQTAHLRPGTWYPASIREAARVVTCLPSFCRYQRVFLLHLALGPPLRSMMPVYCARPFCRRYCLTASPGVNAATRTGLPP